MGCGQSTARRETCVKKKGSTNGDSGGAEQDDYVPLTAEEINARIQSSDGALTYKLGKSGIKLRYAFVSQRGYYPDDLYKNNQDSFGITPSFSGDSSTFFAGVYDGHGTDGDSCSRYVRDQLEAQLKTAMNKYPSDFDRAYKEAFVSCNEEMHEQDFDDAMSGTTAITAYFNDGQVHIANIGDSRAIIGEQRGKRVMAYSLSVDQTPYRADERARVKAAGAVVMSCDQLEGLVPYHEDWGINLGEEIDNGGDPPRVWAPGKSFPGCAFTRSIGDSVAEGIGVTAEPELLSKDISPNDKFIVLASDGVWEFLTNQAVCDMILKFDDPLEACRAVVAEAYRLWLQYEVRTDDITMFLAFFEHESDANGSEPQGTADSRGGRSRRGSADGTSGASALSAAGENRPVRRGLSKEKRRAMAISAEPPPEEDAAGFVIKVVPKAAAELDRIRSAVKANFLFQHLNEAQSKMIFDAMEPKASAAGDVIIQQGDPGDFFYIVESGEYSVTVALDGGPPVEVMHYSTRGGTNPCFGELAILHQKPRSATITCSVAGSLWAIDRRTFRATLMKSASHTLSKTLRSVQILKSLSVNQVQRLEEVLTEVSYADGDYVIRQGEYTDTFYVIVEGTVAVTKREGARAKEAELTSFSAGYFGERALIENEPRAANVIARGPLKCLCIGRDGFEEVLGPLQSIIDEDRRRREKIAEEKMLQQEAEGLALVSRRDFGLRALALATETSELVLATHVTTGIDYTVRGTSKARAIATGTTSRLVAESRLLAELTTPCAFVPLALSSWHDETHLYTVFKVIVVADLQALIDAKGPLPEADATFYAGCVALGLQYLHAEGLAYRNLTPDALMLDGRGYLQLMDLCHAARVDGVLATDTCGSAYYLAPEQVAQLGHGVPVDYWAMGIVFYQMLTGSARERGARGAKYGVRRWAVPWIDPTEDADTVSESEVYQRISTHQFGGARAAGLSESLNTLVNALLHPSPARRLGCTEAGPAALTSHDWFGTLDLEALSRGELEPPHIPKSWCGEMRAALEKRSDGPGLLTAPAPEGDTSWSNAFGVAVS